MTQFFQIFCKTHLHAGSGDSNYGVIDKLVQRDPANKLPCIYASSLKGAFREFYKSEPRTISDDDIFGGGEAAKGKIIFHQAHLLSIPVRSNQFPYFNLVAPVVIDELIDYLQLLQQPQNTQLITELTALKNCMLINNAVVFGIPVNNLKIEDYESANIVSNTAVLSDTLKQLFGNRIALVDDTRFLDLVSDYHLPVIARNCLENGQSSNLWYEQIIPRASRFFFAVSDNAGESCPDFFNLFNDNQLVQIGANATIGYGLCEISKL